MALQAAVDPASLKSLHGIAVRAGPYIWQPRKSGEAVAGPPRTGNISRLLALIKRGEVIGFLPSLGPRAFRAATDHLSPESVKRRLHQV